MNIAYQAMLFAHMVHKDQVRKYTGNPYTDHLAEVVGMTATVAWQLDDPVSFEEILAVAWLHDSHEDQGVPIEQIAERFNPTVASGVFWLSDSTVGTRAERKQCDCARLALAPGWIQTIRCADIISNTASITKHDPKFAEVYLREKRNLLLGLTKADRRLWTLAGRNCQLD